MDGKVSKERNYPFFVGTEEIRARSKEDELSPPGNRQSNLVEQGNSNRSHGNGSEWKDRMQKDFKKGKCTHGEEKIPVGTVLRLVFRVVGEFYDD